ncbi:MAG: universal stress protein [Rhodobacterales bacterium]|nr:universal stress protein [Rhodobacterales bacterium]
MLKTILVAVDGSDHSLRAVDMAANIAACSGARLVLLYVVKSQELPASLRRFAEAEHIAGPDTEVLHRAAEFVLADAGDRARAQGIDDPQREVVEGPPARTIARRADELGCDMVVVGSRGLGDIGGALLGGVSRRVANLAHCAVLTVK